jgi:hypothetical protein
MLSLNQALQNRCDPKIFPTFIQYTVDMLNISLVILNMKAPHIDFEKSEIYHYKNIYNPLNPLVILMYDNGVYYPILPANGKSAILNWTNDAADADSTSADFQHKGPTKDLINKIYKYMKMEDAYAFVKKMGQMKKEERTPAPSLISTFWSNDDEDCDIDYDDLKPLERSDALDMIQKIQEDLRRNPDLTVTFKGFTVEDYSHSNLPLPPSLKGSMDSGNSAQSSAPTDAKKTDLLKKPQIPTKSVLEKMLKEQIEKLCSQHNVPIQKKSDKSGKMIAKTKSDMISDLLSSTKS